jgi:hypothetical protein
MPNSDSKSRAGATGAATVELDWRRGAAVRARRSRFSGGHGGEFGELHCKLDHAVKIEPGLRPRSPENGNISNIRRRSGNAQIRSPETSLQFAQARH